VFDPKNPTLKRRLTQGPGLGAFWFALGNVPLIEMAVCAGAEAVIIDMQHGLFERNALEAAIGAVPSPVPCLVRVEDGTPTALARALDAGAEGVIVPMVETASQAEDAARACHYPPKGHRSGGGVRPLHDFRGYVEAAPDVIAVGVMIETKLGLKNAAAIAAAKNVDFVFIGPGDLSLSLGKAPGSKEHARACAAVRKACRKVGKPCGTFTFGGKDAAAKIAEGYALTIVTDDITEPTNAFRNASTAFRNARPDR
jgi:2-dehydro-3-deoxyglucarate aldolase/4-hydroxy-2-oxoheptanedioate aldolase